MELAIKEIPEFTIECQLTSGEKFGFEITTASNFSFRSCKTYAIYEITTYMLPDIFWKEILPKNIENTIEKFTVSAETIARQNIGTDIIFNLPTVEFNRATFEYSSKNPSVILRFFKEEF